MTGKGIYGVDDIFFYFSQYMADMSGMNFTAESYALACMVLFWGGVGSFKQEDQSEDPRMWSYYDSKVLRIC